MKKRIIILGLLASVTGISCSDRFVDSKFDQATIQAPLNSVEQLQSFVYGAYGSMRSTSYYGGNFLMFGEVRSDEMYSNNGSGYFTTVSNDTMTSSDSYASGPYNAMYTVIAKANIILNTPNAGLTWGASTDATAIANKIAYLKGQAYAVRAQALFDLLRLYGQQYSGGTLGVVIPTVYNPTANMPRATISATQSQIESDFANALSSMNSFAASGNEDFTKKTELNSLSVQSLMSRYYLYKGDYAKVRSLVEAVVNSGKYSVATKDLYKTSFTLQNAAPNSIFELAVGSSAAVPFDGLNAMLYSAGAYHNVVAQPSTLNLYDAADVRVNQFTQDSHGIHVDWKYNDTTGADNIRVCRYEEVLLNGAEAELNGGSGATALGYFNQVVTNRGLAPYTSITMQDIKDERARELIGEGFRQWDLLRWGTSVPIVSASGKIAKVLSIGSQHLAFPIPQEETNVAGTAIVSNPGYDN